MKFAASALQQELHRDQTNTPCKLCRSSTGNTTFQAEEKMFGSGEKFNYLECGTCKAIMLLDAPVDMARYYPENYYSYGLQASNAKDLKWVVQNLIMRSVIAHRLGSYSPFAFLAALLTGKFRWVKKLMFDSETPLLDVGCGHGVLLLLLQRAGFTDLTGADPFIEHDIIHEGGLRIMKKEIHELDRKFGFIMLNHTFEHLAEPLKVMRAICERLLPGAMAMIRIPVADSYAWRKYGADWVQLDAPRHFYLHTVKSMTDLAKAVGLEMEDVVFDSTEFQFLGSEKYIRGIQLDAPIDFLKQSEINRFKKKARLLNAAQQGDTASFYFRKPATP